MDCQDSTSVGRVTSWVKNARKYQEHLQRNPVNLTVRK
jgi:hypothetical protein